MHMREMIAQHDSPQSCLDFSMTIQLAYKLYTVQHVTQCNMMWGQAEGIISHDS